VDDLELGGVPFSGELWLGADACFSCWDQFEIGVLQSWQEQDCTLLARGLVSGSHLPAEHLVWVLVSGVVPYIHNATPSDWFAGGLGDEREELWCCVLHVPVACLSLLLQAVWQGCVGTVLRDLYYVYYGGCTFLYCGGCLSWWPDGIS